MVYKFYFPLVLTTYVTCVHTHSNRPATKGLTGSHSTEVLFSVISAGACCMLLSTLVSDLWIVLIPWTRV